MWPEHLRESVLQEVDRIQVLKPDVLSRQQIFLDATLCCITAEDLARDDGPIFFWGDGSPQHGVDWWLSTLMWIPGSVVETCATSVHK